MTSTSKHYFGAHLNCMCNWAYS